MKYLSGVAFLVLLVLLQPSLGQDSLDIQMADERLSIHAEGVSLGALLSELDSVAGTSSTVGSELASRRVNVWFDDLDLNQSIKKVFQGLGLDYAVVGGSRIIVMDVSEIVAPGPVRAATSAIRANQEAVLPEIPVQPASPNPFQIPGAVAPGMPGSGLPLVPGVPVNPTGGPSPGPTGGPLPFGAPSGTQTLPPAFQNDQNLFGNSSPAILDLSRPRPTVSQPPAPPPPPADSRP